MKALVLTLLFTISGLYAQEQESEKPLCKEAAVILSMVEVPCRSDVRLPADFDIPELEINIEDLGKIFLDNSKALGSESSGGRAVDPSRARMRPARSARPANNFSLGQRTVLTCKAELLNSGGKTIDFLSTTSFKMTDRKAGHKIFAHNWSHFLKKPGSNLLLPSPVKPSVLIPDYKINLSQKGERLKVELCRENVSPEKVVDQICVDKDQDISVDKLDINLKTKSKNLKSKLTITQKVSISCSVEI